jgi:hypothetical protein
MPGGSSYGEIWGNAQKLEHSRSSGHLDSLSWDTVAAMKTRGISRIERHADIKNRLLEGVCAIIGSENILECLSLITRVCLVIS